MEVGKKLQVEGEKQAFDREWERSLCRSIDYPQFQNNKKITSFKNVGEEEPEFSGFIAYENQFDHNGSNKAILEITNAYEGVEVFINEESTGIQILPPYLYDISELVSVGKNTIRIEVATTLERERNKDPLRGQEPKDITECRPTGIVGEVNLYM